MKGKIKTGPTEREAQQIVTPSREASGLQPEYIGVAEAEMLTGFSRWSWRQYAYKGLVESCKLGNRLLIPLSEVRRVIAENTRKRRDGLPAGAPAAPRTRVSSTQTDHANA